MVEPKSPITFRLQSEELQSAMAELSKGSSQSDVLRQGLRLLSQTELNAGAPLYPKQVTDSVVTETIERAAAAAVEVLDELFPAKNKEGFGISSNFHGILIEHLQAMLTGRAFSNPGYQRHLNVLYGYSQSFGRIRSAKPMEGYTVERSMPKPFSAATYFDSDSNRFVELQKLPVGALFTSQQAAIDHVFGWMDKESISPREMKLRLCLVSWEHDELAVTEVAA